MSPAPGDASPSSEPTLRLLTSAEGLPTSERDPGDDVPVRHSLQRHQLPQEAQLSRELADELRQPHEEGEPLIVIDEPQPNTRHLFVVWSSFDGFEQVVRSRVILAAYEAVHGQQAALDVTGSMGLTPE